MNLIEGPSLYIRLNNLSKSFVHRDEIIRVLSSVTAQLESGTALALMGPSGAGKTTLLHLVAGLEQADEGEIWVGGMAIHQRNQDELTRWRNAKVGLIYQQHLLMEELTALENVALRRLIAGDDQKNARDQARHWLDKLGLADRMQHYPAQLSGGEAQRVAIARALVTSPELILADEPTGDLDEATGEKIFQTMLNMVNDSGTTLIVATHNRNLARQCDITWFLHHGSIQVKGSPLEYES